MRRRTWGISAAALVVAVFGALTGVGGGTAVPENPAPETTPPEPAIAALAPETDEWIQIQTAHFIFYSNTSGKRTLELGRRLEKFRAALARFNPKFKVDAAVVTSIYVFRNDASLSPYKLRFKGRPVELNGLFVERSDGNYIVMNGDKYQDPLETIFHEFTHHFLGHNLHAIPTWFNEGMAECYSTFRADDRTAQLGLARSEHIRFLREHPPMPLHDLFAIDQTSPDYNEGDRRGVFYAESWALLHYLIWDKPERKPQLISFLERLDHGEAPDPAFEAAFRTPYKTIETELRAYIAQGHFTHSVLEISKLAIDDTVKTAPMKRQEALYRLGDLLAHLDQDRAPEAVALFKEALRLDPAYGPPHAGLAYLAQQAGRLDEAAELYDKAVRLNPDDAVAALHLGQCLARRTRSEDSAVDLLRAQELFGNAIRVRPDFGEAYVEYAWTLIVQQREVGSAIRMLESARLLLPARTDIVVNLAGLYARQGDSARARDLVENVLARMNDREAEAEARRRVESEGRQSAIRQAGTMIADPQPDEAGADAEPGPDADPPPLPPIATSDDPIHARERQVGIYNDAVARANKGDYKGAMALLEGLLKQTQDDDLRERARTFLDLLKKEYARREKWRG